MDNRTRGVFLCLWLGCCALLMCGCTTVRDSLLGPDLSSHESVTARTAVAGWSSQRYAALHARPAPRVSSEPTGSEDGQESARGNQPMAIETQADSETAETAGEKETAAPGASAGQGDDGDAADRPDLVLTEPYTLNAMNIIRLVYQASPKLRASREEKEAAQHQLAEFKANLSRFEPFAEVRGDASKFPERRDSEGTMGEVVGGVEKETFEGARIRVEGGASASRFEFDEADEGADDVESGSGALLRARVEVPFVGSRRRQERVIAQAFQESTAREAELDYVRNYRQFVETALSYYWSALLYLNYERAYAEQIHALESLRNDRRVAGKDHPAIESAIGAATVLRDQYAMFFRDAVTSLLSTLGIDLDATYTVQEPVYRPSPYIDRAGTEEGIREMLAEAHENNPKFEVLANAIRDAELQRSLAISGKLDVTAFVEGTHFPVGSETFDDRVEGWQVSAGVSVRLNDQRVLSASRKKAEAQIRRYQAEIEAEKRKIEQEIITQTDRLRANDAIRHDILDVIQKTRAEYMERSREYLSGKKKDLTIDDVLRPLQNLTTAEVRLASNVYRSGNAEAELMTATGQVYRVVGMKIENGSDQ